MVFVHGVFACLNLLIVNFLENFTNLYTGIQSNMIKGMWCRVKDEAEGSGHG